jgi:hypothetical protein
MVFEDNESVGVVFGKHGHGHDYRDFTRRFVGRRVYSDIVMRL